MTSDPIIDEVRSIRDAIAKAHDYDLKAIFATLCEREAIRHRARVDLGRQVGRRLPEDGSEANQGR